MQMNGELDAALHEVFKDEEDEGDEGNQSARLQDHGSFLDRPRGMLNPSKSPESLGGGVGPRGMVNLSKSEGLGGGATQLYDAMPVENAAACEQDNRLPDVVLSFQRRIQAIQTKPRADIDSPPLVPQEIGARQKSWL